MALLTKILESQKLQKPQKVAYQNYYVRFYCRRFC